MQETLPLKSVADEVPDLWVRCLDALAQEVPPEPFRIWLKPLQAHHAPESNLLTLRAPNHAKRDWLRQQFAPKIEQALERLAGHPVDLQLLVAPKKLPAPSVAASQTSVAMPAVKDLAAPGGGSHIPETRHTSTANRLNADLTFETLVEGSANRLARAAGQHVAADPGRNYNPLFIYGGVGLGKTHLMHAIGNRLLQTRPQAKVLYIHAEQFVSDVVNAARRGHFDAFKARYHSLDLLLIDDVQFFAGKERTQEEFFNTFESLLAKRSHIVMTSDTYPKALTNISERLVSRFASGPALELEPPELEMRVAILLSKAEADGVQMPEDVAFFIAGFVRSSVRELEGALRQVLAYSRFAHQEISVPLVKEALHDLLSIQNRQISVENIQRTVAEFYRVKVADITAKKRQASIVRPRQVAMYLSKEMTQKSLPEIGAAFSRDHTTVLHAVRRIESERRQDEELNHSLRVLEQMLKG